MTVQIDREESEGQSAWTKGTLIGVIVGCCVLLYGLYILVAKVQP